MAGAQRVLAIIASHELLAKLEPLLGRESLDVGTVISGRSSLTLLRSVAFDLVLVEHPLPDMELGELLAALRHSESASARSPVLAITGTDPAALEQESDDRRLVCRPVSASADELMRAASSQLGVAMRRASRLLVQLGVELGPARILRACQTVDISESGMLLRTTRLLPIGTELSLAFCLPEQTQEIRVDARVVRHATTEGQGPTGLGIAFLNLTDGARERLADFIEERLETQAATASRASARV